MQFTPADASHVQTSVPSKSIANTLYPPPGNTTTAAPLFFTFDEYRVIVGSETLLSRVTGSPATYLSLLEDVVVSASGFDCAPGAVPGQTGRVRA
jgi:hypothetical protein